MTQPYIIPHGMVLMGTCGACGGPVLCPQIWSSTVTGGPPPAQCADCLRMAKRNVAPLYGPIMEMHGNGDI